MNTVIQPVILCGGRGRRLWPVSTAQRPKQFLRLCQDGSLLEATAARVVSRAPNAIAFSRPIIVGSLQHQSRLVRMFPMAKIILEPVQRNTGPAIAAACLTCAPDTLVLVLPTDHVVADIDAFHQAIVSGVAAARRGAIVTFGIDPTYPSTEFGYVQYDGEDGAQAAPVLTVKQFVEKPERPQAERYLAAGSFVWNAGIFLFQASTALESYEAFAPDLLDIVKKSAPDPASRPMTLAIPTYESATSVSFDDAIIAQADNVKMIPADIGWVDIGSFTAMHEVASGPASTLQDQVKTISAWLKRTLDVWAPRAWDGRQGGFVEQLTRDGHPDTGANRRTRVQARQVYSFAVALEHDWIGTTLGRRLVQAGLGRLDGQLRHPDGGWIHTVRPDGTPVNGERYLYDLAFIILAGTAAYRATGDPIALHLAEDALAFINARLTDKDHGGWFEAPTQTQIRCSDSHLHLLEAALALHRATGCTAAMTLADKAVWLFETKLFQRRDGSVAEHFDQDWNTLPSTRSAVIRGGHLYEWSSLLALFEGVSGQSTRGLRRRLIRCADRIGRDPGSGFAHNAIRIDGAVIDSNRRLWPQLEMFRSYWLHPEFSCATAPAKLLQTIHDTYLAPGPDGSWIDETDACGRPISESVPASVLYHLMTAFAPLITNRF